VKGPRILFCFQIGNIHDDPQVYIFVSEVIASDLPPKISFDYQVPINVKAVCPAIPGWFAHEHNRPGSGNPP